MTDPTRDALHAETLRWLSLYHDTLVESEETCSAYAAECVRVRAELEAEVERLRAQRDEELEGNARAFVRLMVQKDALAKTVADFYAEDASNLRAHPDIPWGIGGKSGAEHVAEWRNDLADRIERLLAAYAAATRDGTDAN